MWKVFDITSWNKCELGIFYILITLTLPRLKQYWHYAQTKKVNAHSNMVSEQQERKLCQLSVQHAAWALKIYCIHYNQTLVSVKKISRRRNHKELTPLRKHINEEADRLRGELSLLRCSLIRSRGRDFAAIPIERPSSDSTRRDSELTQEDTMLKHINGISGDAN
uniref:AlNc14C14G1645 protein n=1 Tax=Albugo laibachii Nc14 TaxID=890382 RepID=F0W3R9_9STRA|nr:AlNc14C14G1645 [Albugo laibachii Nc14]|eukprot:CCA15739.1 AlNc14C14G1645 [Albugo laibachii Nc14]